MKINRHILRDLSPTAREALLTRVQTDITPIEPTVRAIIADVRERGDDALLEYTRRFDGADLSASGFQVSKDEFDEAEATIDTEVRDALTVAIANITSHHREQVPTTTWMKETVPGVIAGQRWTPIASAGVYVPRGKGSFPSVMYMLCIPATLAAVPQLVVCTPPGPDGSIDAASLVAARMCGVETVLKLGGAQAVAALAYGTTSIPRVEKVVGPGNQYVTAAKRLLYGSIDPGLPAGPSESMVLCDSGADPEVAARELLVEAEHGPDSAAVLVTDSADLLDTVAARLPELTAALPAKRREYVEQVMAGFGGLVLADDIADAVGFVNDYAPEHLRVLVDRPFELLESLKNTGEILIGEHTSMPYAMYSLGTNAILPTGGTGRSYSGVGVHDFLKRSSFAYASAEGAATIGPAAVSLARYEDFPAHAEAAEYTLERARRALRGGS